MGRLIDVRGECPMGCGKTLHLASDSGLIACISPACPRPLAVSDLLRDPLTDHKVEVDYDGFAIKHPLYERIEDKLFACDLQAWLSGLAEPPTVDGVYRVTRITETPAEGSEPVTVWHFEKIDEEL